MQYTTNLNLKKPEESEFYDVNDFNDNADAIDTALMARLQLAGGTMTGKITQSQDIAINRNVNTASVIIAGGISENEGGRINLYGKNNTTNQGFSVNANDVQLAGKPTGELKWNGKNIVRSVSGIDADINGDIELSKIVTSSAELNALPVGDYFFSGNAQSNDPDTVIAGTDFNGYSMYRAGQATQVLFQGKKIFFRIDDSATVGKTPTYGAWVEFITGNNVATTSEYGIMKLASETDVLSESDEAVVTVPWIYEINDFRRMNTAYSVGDKVACAFEYEHFLECTQAGTTSNTTLDTRNVTHGQVITDGTVKWTVRTHIRSINGVVADENGNIALSGIPTGTILPFAGGTIPSGFLPCNGAAVSRTTYSALFSAIGTTYGGGNGSSTFNLPAVEDNRFLEFSSTRGTKKNAGLPNITGRVNFWSQAWSGTQIWYNQTGAFYSAGNNGNNGGLGSSTSDSVPALGFDASRSNGLYGDSNTVQPKSLTVRAIIKY